MATAKADGVDRWIAAGPTMVALVLSGIALLVGFVEMRVTLSGVSDDLAEVKTDVATIERLLFDRWTQDSFREHAEIAPTQFATPIAYDPVRGSDGCYPFEQ